MEEIKPENILVSYTKEFDKICKNILHGDVTAQLQDGKKQCLIQNIVF